MKGSYSTVWISWGSGVISNTRNVQGLSPTPETLNHKTVNPGAGRVAAAPARLLLTGPTPTPYRESSLLTTYWSESTLSS